MKFSPKTSLYNALHSAWIIVKLVIPIYIIADVLFYYEVLQKISFLFTPLTSFLGLPHETALSLISGMTLNLYAAIAFAAPLELTPKDWTVLGVFLGICHSLIIETAIMKQLSIPKIFSISLRFIAGLFVGWIITVLPNSWFQESFVSDERTDIKLKTYDSLSSLLQNSTYEAFVLGIEIILLISVIIFILNII